MKIRALCVLAGALLAAAAHADELHLRDGRVLVGDVSVVGDTYQVDTREGIVRVPRSLVVDHIEEATLRASFRDRARRVGPSAFSQLQLAIDAHSHGLDRELWQHLDAALATTAQEGMSPAMASQLYDFLGQLEPDLLAPKWRKAETSIRIRELLALLKKDRASEPSRHAALLELLRREPNADKDLRMHARGNKSPLQRMLAVEALARRGTAGNDKFTMRTAVLDDDARVRTEAIRIVKRNDLAAGAVDYMAPGLMHPIPDVRIRTAEAFAELGDVAAVKHLVVAGPSAGKALAVADEPVRAHVAFLNQQAYIRDFDVEVAQASFIANPQIGVLQSGTVLDVAVVGVEQYRVRIQRAFRQSIQKLAGSDPGADARKWPTWLMRNPISEEPAPTTGDR